MDKRIGTYSDKDGNGFVKPVVTVTGGKLMKNVAHNTRGIGGNYFVYLDIHKNLKAEEAIKAVSELEEVKLSRKAALAKSEVLKAKSKSTSKAKANEPK